VTVLDLRELRPARTRLFETTIIAFIGISWWKGLRQGGRQRLSPVACPDPVHLVLTPTWPTVWLALGKAHRGASAFIKARLGATGHLFLSRFGSVAMDEDHLMAARTVALNPVMARLVERAQDGRGPPPERIFEGRNDGLVDGAPLLSRAAGCFADLLDEAPARFRDSGDREASRAHTDAGQAGLSPRGAWSRPRRSYRSDETRGAPAR
jgi:hypothetical protein